jgi:hypothetical protein
VGPLTGKELWVTRLLLERGIGLISLIAFIVALNQFKPLLGERGLLPVPLFLKQVPFSESPSLFYLFPRNTAFAVFAWLGILLSCLLITGLGTRTTWSAVSIWLALYLLYISFVNVGQTFYAFGWESILLEALFFGIFLGGSNTRPSEVGIWLFRWLLFRIMFGAGLIKLRGDPCWRDLTCLNYHYETQPMPNPLSWYFHWAPQWVNKSGVLFNHFAELIVPFGYLLPQPIASIAGVITIIFQGTIIASGNLSWLNWLTLVLAFSTLDGGYVLNLLHWPRANGVESELPVAMKVATIGITALVVLMSIPVVTNMLSARQVMNTSFNSLHLVGTYGAFGSITKPRYEVIVEGTDSPALDSTTQWREYEFKGKPGELGYRPPQIAPYHLRLDWLMWFAAMSDYRSHPWFVNFLAKLLQNDRDALGLVRVNPFPERPPRYVRALRYEYHFTTAEERESTGKWWTRRLIETYFPPVSLDTPAFRQVLEAQGWLTPDEKR